MAQVRSDEQRSIVAPALVSPILGLAFAVVCGIVGVFAGFLISDRNRGTDTEALPGLYGMLIGFALGFFIGCLAGGWLLTRGRNHRPFSRLLAGAWLPAGLIAGWIVDVGAASNGYPALGPIVGIAVSCLVFLGLIFGVGESPSLPRGLALLFSVVLVGAATVAGLANRNNAFANRLEESGIPLAVVNEDALAATLPGWQVVEYDRSVGSYAISDVDINVVTDTGFELELNAGLRTFDCLDSQTCEPLASLDDGSSVTRVTSGRECEEGQTALGRIDVTRPSGAWILSSARACTESAGQPTVEELEAFLATLEPATPEAWVEAGP